MTAADLDTESYLFERYKDQGGGARSSAALLRGYYELRPLIPRRLQIGLRRLYARRQLGCTFPHWPIEPVLVERQRADLLSRVPEGDGRGVPLVNFWPGRKRFAWILTHDVEGTNGIENIPRLLEVERRHGCVSSWNFCAEEYPIGDGVFERIRDAGCEIGLHGIDHKCKLFSTRARFEADLPKIHRYLDEWGAVGFRSPALHRNADWMPELGCLYDSSYPDTDPFEPQPGGCCSIFPFLNGEMVELPVTLVQDHTLFDILGHRTIDAWRDKADWISRHHGLVNVIVHPDYMLSDERLGLYEELIVHLKGLADGWHALPRDVAAWWAARERMTVGDGPGGAPAVLGDGSWGAMVAHALRDARGELQISVGC